MPLDPDLLALLSCPIDKGPLLYVESDTALYNPRLRRRYRIVNDVPVLLPDQALPVDDAEHARLMRGSSLR
ncbi:Trm112 family protein [Catenulispora subtropica]|uniref:Trm112 family protein n=1 Tax=Catenulispora subtropica TaxID=450798 RepID=A0ABN2SK46_9ACTN